MAVDTTVVIGDTDNAYVVVDGVVITLILVIGGIGTAGNYYFIYTILGSVSSYFNFIPVTAAACLEVNNNINPTITPNNANNPIIPNNNGVQHVFFYLGATTSLITDFLGI